MKQQTKLQGVIVAVIAVVFGAILTFTFGFKPLKPDAVIARAQAAQLAQCKLAGETPGGVAYRAVSQPSPAMIQAIDRAWEKLDRVAEFYGYANKVARENYVLYLMPEERLSTGGAPSLTVPIRCSAASPSSYCGTDYEKGELTLNDDFIFDARGAVKNPEVHYITASERVIAETLGAASQIYTVIVPKTESDANLRTVEDSARNGAEHFFNYNNDRLLYERTIGAGRDAHPSLPLPDEPGFPFVPNF